MTVSAVDVLNEGVPDGYVVVSAVVVICALDGDGDEVLIHRHDEDASVWKHIGMLQVTIDDYRDACRVIP